MEGEERKSLLICDVSSYLWSQWHGERPDLTRLFSLEEGDSLITKDLQSILCVTSTVNIIALFPLIAFFLGKAIL
jgi:hypothetical protein